ncbi:amidohydrolase family protein [Ferruginibacter sp. HRS2-29]|uniref:amidohydrolase family protein n=1 Tax=Ferruginibacter sp. HRS2-29 TaxID=2487334 RepID=UPI0020CBB785|nr:amidohydrolase family protein [Ferruginibacter sp. HRS2-29]MCP9752996.1 hypothetical protein [Ferruginibacter sp. HRS2-29]
MTDQNIQDDELPIINCHTHIFTGDHVPPFLAKTFIPWPFYYLFPVNLIVGIFRLWYNHIYTWQFKPWYGKLSNALYSFRMFFVRNGLLSILSFLIGSYISVQVFFILFDWLSSVMPAAGGIKNSIEELRRWLGSNWNIYVPESTGLKLLMIVLLLLFFKPGRNLIWFLVKNIWTFLGVLPGSETKKLAGRYLNIGRYAFYRQQGKVFGRIKSQYPPKTKFIVLPMDMEFMGAGRLNKDHLYAEQMRMLAAIKNNKENSNIIFPFVFADPRRIQKEGKAHFDYSIDTNGKIRLNDCFIKRFIEDEKFSGFKIYPALGYFPFDELLLPLWKYAADNALPVLTHCIRGTIYYRGRKNKAWDKHPVFTWAAGNYVPMPLTEIRNRDFINNFTHPLNYLCLLEEQLLRKLVAAAKDDRIRQMFGYKDADTRMDADLSHLKLCFGHFGGDDEWDKFFESDRDNYSSQLVKYPETGISFMKDEKGNPAPGKLEQVWKYVDWYSTICSMMLQYDHVYADLSYIIHNPSIEPLLRHTLSNKKLLKKVLFGTDFYVVRNHKTEKHMLADVLDYLPRQEFDQIAKVNPRNFLINKTHTTTLK